MTVRAIAGLFLFNALLLGVGIGVLWGVRGWRSWGELVRLSGFAYLLGVAATFFVLTIELVLGIPVTVVTALAGVAVVVLTALLVRRRRGRDGTLDADAVERAGIRLSVGTAALVGIAGVYLVALFRAGRLADLAWDVWASWLPKAKAIYHSGEIDPELFASLPGASYPPGLPALHALAFHAMGSADATTLHLQYWFLAVGFFAAVLGLLTNRVRSAILVPCLVLLLVLPDVRNRATDLYGDIPLGYLIAASALLLLLWIRDRQAWKLAATTVLMGGAMLTKREGILFVLCLVVAALVATIRERRYAWPRVAAAGMIAFAIALPWRAWFMLESLPSDAPESGYLGVLDHLDRARPSHELVIRTLFDYDLWLLVPTLAIVASVLAYMVGARREVAFTLVFLATAVVGSAWTFWSNPSLGLGAEEGLVNRVVGTPVLVLGAILPLLLELAWRGSSFESDELRPEGVSRRWAWVAAVAATSAFLVYPAITLAGGDPTFPSPEDCVRQAIDGQPVQVVFGYRDTFSEAIELRDRALEVGFQGTAAAQDGCGRVRVSVGGIPSLAVGREIQEEAASVGLHPTLELDIDG